MAGEQKSSGGRNSASVSFWDALAPHHFSLENNYLDTPSVHRIIHDIESPVLVVGAGQGLIVAELLKNGFQCDGIDFSTEMIRHAKLRRGITLIHADAEAMPFADRTYPTVIYATGVIDFTGDEKKISLMLGEGRRIVRDPGKIFVAFYRLSPVQERFMEQVGLLHNHEISLRQSFELYLLNPAQMIAWVAQKANLNPFHAVALLFRMATLSTLREKRTTFRMKKILRKMADPRLLINTVHEKQPYRGEAEIRILFQRLAIPLNQLDTFATCFMARV